jgi:hypothetical protein
MKNKIIIVLLGALGAVLGNVGFRVAGINILSGNNVQIAGSHNKIETPGLNPNRGEVVSNAPAAKPDSEPSAPPPPVISPDAGSSQRDEVTTQPVAAPVMKNHARRRAPTESFDSEDAEGECECPVFVEPAEEVDDSGDEPQTVG